MIIFWHSPVEKLSIGKITRNLDEILDDLELQKLFNSINNYNIK